MRQSLCSIALFSAIATTVPMNGASARDQASAAGAQVQALEAAFEARTRQVGIAAAFKAFASPEALMFLPGPIKIWPKLEGAFWAGDIVWKPEVIVASSDGDMVVTAGPSLWTTAGKPQPGIYLTVWRPSGDSMKFTLDRGLNTPRNLYVEVAGPTALPPAKRQSASQAESAIRSAETAIAVRGQSQDPLISHLDDQVRVYRHDHEPAIGKQNAERLVHATAASNLALSEVVIASSGDVAYTWGKQMIGDKPAYFTRVWRLTASGWRVAIDFAA